MVVFYSKKDRELNNNLTSMPQWITDHSTGKITGYKTPGGADTVFPFSSTISFDRSIEGSVTVGAKKSQVITLTNKPTLIYAGYENQLNSLWIYNGGDEILIHKGVAIHEIIENVDRDAKTFVIHSRDTSTRTFKYCAFY